ncbi:MAG TPA: cell division protein ZapB [Thermoanaerobaculia bacterium]|nr:cell division protein ZapB [Thermoanaerobaculia bacterium]
MDIAWLETLETRVRDAAERLRELKEENAALKERIRELESDTGGGGWEEEREEIRRRVEALTRRLEELAEV